MSRPWHHRIGDRLSRRTSTGRYVREIDGLRFIAIFTVVYQHLQRTLIAEARGGRMGTDAIAEVVERWRGGVQLFFVVSGLVLALPFAAHRLGGGEAVSLRRYFLRRLTRLEPPYLLMLALFYAAKTAYQHLAPGALLRHLLWSMVYLHAIRYGVGSDINAVTWSLESEVQFYVLAPLLASVFLIRRRWARRGLLVAAILVFGEAYGAIQRHYNPPYSVLNDLGTFLAGFLLADVFVVDWRGDPPPSSKWWDLAAIPGWLLLLPAYFRFERVPHTHLPIPRVVLPLLLASLVWVAFRSHYVRGALRLRPVAITGGMCYTIYLLHFPPMRVAARLLRVPLVPGGVTVNTVVYLLPFCLFLATFCLPYFLLVERPCMRKDWPQRLWGWATGRPPPPAPQFPAGTVESLVHVPPAETDPLATNQPVP